MIYLIKLNIDSRKQCEFFGFTENHENESILIFHSCSTNLNLKTEDQGQCQEKHIGNTPRSIMTKGTSTRRKNRLPGSLYGNFDPGNNDKLMITYRREPSHDYTMLGACGVLFEGKMHFFGGDPYINGIDFTRQHFVIETKRSGQLVKMTKQKDLEIRFEGPACSSFQMTSEYFPWFSNTVVILCFDIHHRNSCYSFDGKLTFFSNSNYDHFFGGLTKYDGSLLTVGGTAVGFFLGNQKTEILKINETKNFIWSVVEPDFKFTQGEYIAGHSVMTVPSSDINEEYVLVIGGRNDWYRALENVFKFNGTWFRFGKLSKPRNWHSSIYWNGAVYVIGGRYNEDMENFTNVKMEIWNIKNSPDEFQTKENWPELLGWASPHLFIVSDSFFPDH